MKFLGVFITLIAAGAAQSVNVIDGYDPGSCDKSNHAEQVLIKDREDNEKILVCAKNNDIYEWKTVDGLSLVGEIFNPGYDCSDILDKLMQAKDGFYWVQFDGSTPKKVWCDMTTDGGGYMLIGHKNDSIAWDVPSNDNPVDPSGDPHWSSDHGDAPILDFRVQMSIGSDFTQTKADWSFRLNNKRLLENLMIMGEKGCDNTSPGIGDIAYVKDLVTGNIVTTSFRCSKFGLGYPARLTIGWAMMNSCLKKACPWGFGYHHTYPIQIDSSGAFSFSATNAVSGMNYNATAFVGCNNGHCCGCYGPVGGTDDYCTEKCQPINGGFVTTNIKTWFWVRSTLPKRVWNKCMEYKVTNESGHSTWYKLVEGSVNPTQGRCVQNKALLNDGVVVVPDAESAEKVPSVPGLVAYRKDNKKLYLRANETWNEIAQEKQVLQKTSDLVEPKLNEFEKKLNNQSQQILQKTSDLVEPKLNEFEKKLNNQSQQITNVLGKKLTQLDAKVEKSHNNQTKRLNSALVSFNSMFVELEKQLQKVNQTVNYLEFGDFLSSVILKRGQNYLSQLKKWLPVKSSRNLCWRASTHGWSASTFHSYCDNKGPTVTIIRVGNYVFGGYTDQSWDSLV